MSPEPLSNVRSLAARQRPKGLKPAPYDHTAEKAEQMVLVDRNAVEYLARFADEAVLAFEAGQGRSPRSLPFHRDCIKAANDALGRKS